MKVDASVEVTDLEIELMDAKAELAAEIIIATPDAVKQKLLILRYVDLLPFTRIAAEMNFSEAHIYYLHRHAVKEFNSQN